MVITIMDKPKHTDALIKAATEALDGSESFVYADSIDLEKIIADAVTKIDDSMREERRLLRALVGSPEFGSIVRSTTLRSMYQQWVDEYR